MRNLARLIEGIHADSNYLKGIRAGGLGTIIRRCVVSRTGGSSPPIDDSTDGIRIEGVNGTVLDCDVTEVGGRSYGILSLSENVVVENCRVSNAVIYPNSNGILLFPEGFVSECRVRHMTYGIRTGRQPIKAANNLTLGCQFPFEAVATKVGYND